MPRISLYKPELGQDYRFIDRQISEMFQAGGTDIYLHKYIGTEVTDANGNIITKDLTQIQDLVFLENRDRKYDQEIYRIRGFYNVQNIDFNLSQFGLFIDNDTLFMTVHINDFIKYIGRKPISGDVLELPHLRDQFALNDADISLPRYYVIEDVGRASEGFSVTWMPHLYRLKLKKITDSQQFADILNRVATDSNGDPDPNGTTLQDLLSTYNTEIAINNAIISEAETDSAKSGYETRQFFTLAVDANGKSVLNTVDSTDPLLLASSESITATETNKRPVRSGYTGYLLGDGFPVNGYEFGMGIQFPDNPGLDDYFLRTDFLPNRLFKFDGSRWVKQEDAVRMNMTNNDTRQTLKTSFINNDKYVYDQAVGIDYVLIPANSTVIDTTINYDVTTSSAMYVVLKLDSTELAYVSADHTNIIVNYNSKVRLQLPSPGIAVAGTWRVSLCNNREAQRQSLSKALRPKADL